MGSLAGKGENKTFWEKAQDIDRRILWVPMVILAIYVFNNPIGLPIPVTPLVRTFYEFNENLPQDSVVLICADWGAVNELNIGTQFRPLLIQLSRLNQEKNVRFVVFGLGPDVVTMFPLKLNEPAVERAMEPLVYGEDWVFLGYVSGKETGMAALCKGIKDLLSVDYYGNSLEDLPILDDANVIQDFAGMYGAGGSDIEVFIRQVAATYGTPTAILTQGIVGPIVEPYIPELIFTQLVDIKAAAEYEYLVGTPGPAISGMDVQNVIHIYLFALIALGNIAYFVLRNQRRT